MSKYSPGKLYGMGQLAKEKGQALEGDEWKAWVRKNQIDALELQYIMDGLEGRPFELHHKKKCIPFSPFTGRLISEMTEKYLRYLLTKDWLDEWDDLRLNIEHHLKDLERKKKQETDIILDTIKQIK